MVLHVVISMNAYFAYVTIMQLAQMLLELMRALVIKDIQVMGSHVEMLMNVAWTHTNAITLLFVRTRLVVINVNVNRGL